MGRQIQGSFAKSLGRTGKMANFTNTIFKRDYGLPFSVFGN
nr:MAG TPA: hypothetical protein [Caudoviricetes sp.]